MKKILVINFRYFGDALISASLSVRIRELWPDAHITYLVFDSVEGVLEGIETIDEILTVPERPGKWEQFRWMVAHWNNYDLAFVTQTGTRPGLYGFFAGVQQAKLVEKDAPHEACAGGSRSEDPSVGFASYGNRSRARKGTLCAATACTVARRGLF